MAVRMHTRVLHVAARPCQPGWPHRAPPVRKPGPQGPSPGPPMPNFCHPRATSGSVPCVWNTPLPLGQQSASSIVSAQLTCHWFREVTCHAPSAPGPLSVTLSTYGDRREGLLRVSPALTSATRAGPVSSFLSRLLKTWVGSWGCLGEGKQFTRRFWTWACFLRGWAVDPAPRGVRLVSGHQL